MRSPVRSDTGRKLFISYFDPRHRCTTTADLRITCISRGDRRRRRTVPPRARSRDHTCGATTFSLRLFSRVRFSLSPPSPSSSIVHSPFGRSSDRTCVVPAAALVVELSSVPSIDLKHFYFFFFREISRYSILFIFIYITLYCIKLELELHHGPGLSSPLSSNLPMMMISQVHGNPSGR